MKIQKLKTLRLILSVVAVILAIATAAVGMLWLPEEPQQPAPPRNPGVSTSPTTQATEPAQTTEPSQETVPSAAPTETAPGPAPLTSPDDSKGGFPGVFPDRGQGDEDRESPGDLEGWGVDGYTPAVPPVKQPPEQQTPATQPPAEGDDFADMVPGMLDEEGGTDTVPEEKTPGGDTVSDKAAADDGSQQEQNPVNMPIKKPGINSPGTAIPGAKEESSGSAAKIVFIILCVLLVADIGGIVAVSMLISKAQKEQGEEKTMRTAVTPGLAQPPSAFTAGSEIQIGQLHNIGARPYQEDSSGVSRLDDGVLAVVADGMGGLSGGDKVSQKIVYTMLSYGDQLRPGYIDGALERMVHGTNEAVNAMLGPEGLYKSGSTLLAVLARNGRFHWITVGDSHIYYFHDGKLVQLNEEHNRGTELLHQAARGEITYEEAKNDPKKSGLTSFIGMGRLKYIDKSVDSIPISKGDRIMLSTDGVFNALPDQTIEAVLKQYPDVQAAADEMERLVIQRANPRQDNFTAVILGF